MKRNAEAFELPGYPEGGVWPAGGYRFWRGKGQAADQHGVNFGCPCGCGLMFGAKLSAGGWRQTGAWPDTVSLTPSLGCGMSATGGQFHWHGFLRNGVFEEC